MPSELTEAATRQLDTLVARDGVTKTKLRALAFLARYFGDDVEVEAELEAVEGELRALRERLGAYEAADVERKRKDDETFLERLRDESATANAPIPNEDMERVAALLRAGQAETAKVVGEAFLARSKAQGQTAFTRGDVLPLNPTDRRARFGEGLRRGADARVAQPRLDGRAHTGRHGDQARRAQERERRKIHGPSARG